jgi:hypothetical protein
VGFSDGEWARLPNDATGGAAARPASWGAGAAIIGISPRSKASVTRQNRTLRAREQVITVGSRSCDPAQPEPGRDNKGSQPEHSALGLILQSRGELRRSLAADEAFSLGGYLEDSFTFCGFPLPPNSTRTKLVPPIEHRPPAHPQPACHLRRAPLERVRVDVPFGLTPDRPEPEDARVLESVGFFAEWDRAFPSDHYVPSGRSTLRIEDVHSATVPDRVLDHGPPKIADGESI